MYLKTASKLNSELKEMKIERPKTPRKLPNVLSKEEIIKIVSVLKNLKHRTVISLIYSAGLRISEAVKMEIRDIDFNRKIINIKDAKGKKDRQTALSLKIEKLLLEYMAFYKPSKYIFEGAGGEKSGLTHQCLYFEQPHTFEQILFIQTAEPALVGHA